MKRLTLAPVVAATAALLVAAGPAAAKDYRLGLITPPVGINVYVVAGASPDLTVEDAFKGVLWFGAVDAMTIAVLFAFPALVTYLPGLIG